MQPFETVTFNKGVAGKACRKGVKGGLKSSSGEGKRLLRKGCCEKVTIGSATFQLADIGPLVMT